MPQATKNSKGQVAAGFAVVWMAGIVASLLVLILLVSGTLWNLGFPYWLIISMMYVGFWQWFWVVPLLSYAARNNRLELHKGLRAGAVGFTIAQTIAVVGLYSCCRNFGFH